MSAVIDPVAPFDYLRTELNCEGRHEYVNGRVYALSGSSITHGQLISNMHFAVMSAARKTYCRAFTQCMLVSVPAYNSFYYPDVLATCEHARGDQQLVGAPCFIAEVLSPSTSGIDKREKRIAYASLDSLQEYVVVYQSRMRVDVHQRTREGWKLTILHQPEDVVPISCLRGEVSLEEIYRGVSFHLRVAEGFDEDDDEDWLRIVASSRKGDQPSPASCPKLMPTVLNPPST